MTAIKPLENLRVRAVAAETYPINVVCAHPDCEEGTNDPHHCFPRSLTGGDSYFVAITFDSWEDAVEALGKNPPVTEVKFAFTPTDERPNATTFISQPIPHAIGLCRLHHDWVEQRRAHIVLSGGVYSWFEGNDGKDGIVVMSDQGELNPQPGATRSKPKKKRLAGEARRKRRVISIRVPDDTEDGGAVWDETLDRVKARLVEDELYAEGDLIPVYEAIIAGLTDWLNTTREVTK